MHTESDFLHSFFENLNSTKINYAVLRKYQDLPNSCGGSDIDIWINKEHYLVFCQILYNSATLCGGYLVSFKNGIFCPRLIYQAVNWGVQFDVHLGVSHYKGVPYVNNSIIESNITEYNGIKVLAPEIDSLISFLKEILYNKKCNLAYCNQAHTLVCKTDLNILHTYLCAFSEPVIDKIILCLKNKDFSKDSLRDLGNACSSDLINFTSRVRYGVKMLKKIGRLLKQPGYTIAILGTDGSGKSFIIDSITPILNGGFHNGIKYEHMRPNYLTSLASATGKKKKVGKDHLVCTDPHGSKPSGFAGSIVRLSYYWIDYTFGYFRKIYLDKATQSHVWLFDRYYYDFYIDQRRAGINLPSWLVKVFGFFVPSPDLTICLGGDPEKIYERKPETSLEEVIRQTKMLKSFAETHKRTVWIDTTIPPKESINKALKAIVEMMSKRYKN